MSFRPREFTLSEVEWEVSGEIWLTKLHVSTFKMQAIQSDLKSKILNYDLSFCYLIFDL